MTAPETETLNPEIETRNSQPEAREKPAAGKQQRTPTLPLLLEVGCEEIPARFLSDAQKGLGERLVEALLTTRLLADASSGQGRIATGEIPQARLRTFSTPRRLVAYLPSVLERQLDFVETVVGPPVKVAIDAQGNYTRAAESFAQKNSARVGELARTSTPKGEYLCLRKTILGRPALEVLPEILPEGILGLTFPKSMYWTEMPKPLPATTGWGVYLRRFVRPIRWIVAILGEGKNATTVDFKILGVNSGNFTFGHRAMGHNPLHVTGFKYYLNKLEQSLVEIDHSIRMDRVVNGIDGLVDGVTLRTVINPGLQEWVVNSTEWPRPILGNFDERFLHLPREILITVMHDHQKYFAVEDQQGNLRPHFVAVLNMESDEKGLIRQGHERVLTARFRDAEFFWNADQRISLRDRIPLLEKVTYQAKLGSYADKVRRMERLGRGVSAVLYDQERLSQSGQDKIKEAIKLAKCDLTTQMVQEFPELQGVVGGLYAKFQGENAEIAEAVSDHYAPQSMTDLIPRTLVGAVVALADKLDAVTSGFVAGLVPTGSSDPFGLRRQANGIVRIIVEFSIDNNLRPYVLDIIDGFASNEPALQFRTQQANAIADAVIGFIRDRVGFYLGEVEGMEYDIVRAALFAHESIWRLLENSPLQMVERARGLRSVRKIEGFVKLCGAAKRIRNILSKSADSPESLGCNFNENFFHYEEEKSLGRETQSVERQAQSLAREKKFEPALLAMVNLVDPIDKFFEKVLVMDEDRQKRENRLRLLNRLNQMFSAVVDLSQVVIE
jgi:glycyl-tRNA synthetase beta chain